MFEKKIWNAFQLELLNLSIASAVYITLKQNQNQNNQNFKNTSIF